jgi:predicted nuclease of predicted toxin-antitoxin system
VKVLLDVNAGRAISDLLANLGYDVAWVADSDPRMRDGAILDWAMRERRVVITTDKDFEEMIWRESRPHCGVLRLESLPRVARLQPLQETLTRYQRDLADGAIVIASRRHIRLRRP